MRVHILSNGFCQQCANELSWKQGERVARQQQQRANRVAYFKKAEKFIDKKWKQKYGDSSKEEVLEYK